MTLLDAENRPLVTEREIQRHLRAIVDDADKTAANEAARGAVGVLSE
jgi:carnitine O-acetyltransferase